MPNAENSDTSAVAMSLADAFASGKPWTPRFHARWLESHKEIAGYVADDGSTTEESEEGKEINADELFKILIDFKNRVARFEHGPEDEQQNDVALGLRGVTAHNLIVTGGPLNLTSLVFPTPLDFSGCCFPGGIVLDNARLGPVDLSGASARSLHADAVRIDGDLDLHYLQDAKWIDLRGGEITGCLYLYDCHLNKDRDPAVHCALRADGISVKASVFLSQGFIAEGKVDLIRAAIGGVLSCGDGSFRNSGKIAIDANSATVQASVFLRNGFVAEGEVNLTRATIGGHLDCNDGAFRNLEGAALSADAITVQGGIFLSKNFSAEGEVRLFGATIGGQLACIGGTFRNPGKTALDANGATVRASVLLRSGFAAEGEVCVVRATIGGQLDCSGGTFRNRGKTALTANSATIQASAFLRDGFVAEGEVNFVRATIGGQLDCDGGTFRNPGMRAFNADAVTVKADAYMGDGFVAEGEVNLVRATIEGRFSCDRGTFHNIGKIALQADAIIVRSSIFLRVGFSAEGMVNLRGATIGGQLSCAGGVFRNEAKTAFKANAIAVQADVFLSDGFTADGEVNLRGATISGQLGCDGGTFHNPGKIALLADAITVQATVFLRDGFTAEGEVSFCRANISGSMQCRRGSFTVLKGDATFAALDLNGAHIGSTLFLTQLSSFSGRLDLRNATVQRFADDGSAWPEKGNLWLNGFHYDDFSDDWATVKDPSVKRTPTDFESRYKWLMLQPISDLKERLKPQPWTQCAKVLLSIGHSRDARLLLHARDHLWLKTKQPGWLTKFFLGSVMGVLAGYGYKSYYAFYWALGFLFAGWLLFGAAYDKGLIWRINQGDNSQAVEVFHPFAYTLDSFLPGIRLGETAIWRPYGKGEAILSSAVQHHAIRALAPLGCPNISKPSKVLADYLPALCKTAGAVQAPVVIGVDRALDAGLARVCLWVETVMGWLLFGVLAAGLTGILQRKIE